MPTTVQEKATPTERFAEAFETHASHLLLNGTAETPLGRPRREAFRRFRDLGVPTSKLEAWKYTNISKTLRHEYRIALADSAPDLDRGAIEPFLIPGLDAHRVVLVDGRFSEALSDIGDLPDGVLVTNLAEAAEARAGMLEDYYNRLAGDLEGEALVALNTAFAQDGAVVYVPRGVVLERPVFVLHLTQSKEDVLTQPRSLFVVEENASARVVEARRTATGARVFANAVTETFVGRHGHFDHYLVQDEGARASQTLFTAARQEPESVFDTHTFTLSGEVVRNDLVITPDGEHCETHLRGLYLGQGQLHVDNHTVVEHAKPDCFSNELYKGILAGSSTGVFNGRVHVHRDAQRINAYQSNKNIVLENTAAIYSKPELEIYADDVQCSHGSTTGQLDEEAIFYLQTRGLSQERAKRLLLRAFARDVVETVKSEPLRAYLDEEIAKRFETV